MTDSNLLQLIRVAEVVDIDSELSDTHRIQQVGDD